MSTPNVIPSSARNPLVMRGAEAEQISSAGFRTGSRLDKNIRPRNDGDLRF